MTTEQWIYLHILAAVAGSGVFFAFFRSRQIDEIYGGRGPVLGVHVELQNRVAATTSFVHVGRSTCPGLRSAPQDVR